MTADRDYGELTFLIADDKPFIRNLINSMLLQSGARHIVHASNGEEALKALRKAGGKFNCIISDWNMAPINGLQLLQMIRAGDALPTPVNVCFILLTGTADSELVNAAIVLDVSAYLVKPVSREKLVKAISTALDRRWTPKSPAHYRAITAIELPDPVPESAERSPAWILWLEKSPKRAQVEQQPETVKTSVRKPGNSGGAPELKFKNKQRKAVGEIVPGSVLAEDIRDGAGKLLIASGTVLNESVLSRLRELALESGQDVKLWIGTV